MENSNKKILQRKVRGSRFWREHWKTCPIVTLSTVQFVSLWAIVGMEIGNSIVDIYRANIYSGFWCFPFLLASTVTSYASVLLEKTRTKATIALVLQSMSIFVLLVSIGFLIAFISTTFTMCIGTQCSQTSNSFVSQSNTSPYRFSTETYYQLKRIFIGFHLAFSVLFLICSIIYIILFIRCVKEVPHIYPSQDLETMDKLSIGRRLTSIPSSVQSARSSTIVYTTTTSYYRAQKVCPNCKHVSEYVPDKDIVECPKCKYQSPLVEHAQQC